MKSIYFLSLILIIFFKTGNVLSNENIFSVNNIQILKKNKISNEELANKAIIIGFKKLAKKILLDKDIEKVSRLEFNQIKPLVSYYQVITKREENQNLEETFFNIFFDKEKLHELFYQKDIFYSEILDKELYFLPVLKKNDELLIFTKNYFYENWDKLHKNELVEFILPLENIEIIQQIKKNEDNLLNISLENLFQGYNGKNLALVLIQLDASKSVQIFFKTNILGKNINKSIKVDRLKNIDEFDKYLASVIEKKLINLIKSQNLVDVKTPSFLNTKFKLKKQNNLVELNNRLEKIDLIESIYVQELNNDYVNLKIKYLGKLNKIINQLEGQNIILKLSGEEWTLEII